ncbi:hypothetical protein PV328_000174 [Microctonus aethiopoides]|uniref:G patch domain-containing protein 11 n=1 Tax=Microctonus aethiopoides TaxID=144406 RepID=A0AA39FUP0_9HYME|nr:hypothetical protein PV328_000174 [Microctonus aethiopoides]
MADDDDYMSEKFIMDTTCKAPGLILKHSDKRAIEIKKRKAAVDEQIMEKKKLSKTMEQDKRNEGLSSAISANNKGFEMIMKMGYKPGRGIGKNESGLSEPIPMNLKTNRTGLGTISKKQSTKKINPIEKLLNIRTDEFRDRIASKKLAQLTEIDLIKSQKVCEELDIKSNVAQPIEPWYWPTVPKVKELSDDDDDSDNKQINKNKNKNLDNEEIEDEDEEEYSRIKKPNRHIQADSEDENDDDDADAEVNIPTEIKLDTITKYLRKQYAYCIWCGASYDNQEDLNDNCPGNTRGDH